MKRLWVKHNDNNVSATLCFDLPKVRSSGNHQHRVKSKWTKAWDCHKLHVHGLSYNWWGFQAQDTLQDSTDNSSIDRVETSLEWQEHFSHFHDTTNALPCHIHLPVCLWIIDLHSRAPKKNASHGNEVLPQDTTHLIQKTMLPTRKSVPRSSRQPDHEKTSWPSSSGHLRSLRRNSRTTCALQPVWLYRQHVLALCSQQSGNSTTTENTQCLPCVAERRAGRELVRWQVRKNQKEKKEKNSSSHARIGKNNNKT